MTVHPMHLNMRLRLVCALFVFFTPHGAHPGWDLGESAYKQRNYSTAVREWLPLAKEGNVEAQYNIGIMYSQGQGMPRDMASAAYWWEKAALQGHVRGQNNIANLLRDGIGVAKDLPKAVYWFKAAAIKDYADAQYDLGLLYRNGHGVSKDLKVVLHWWNLAADAGNKLAKSSAEALNSMIATVGSMEAKAWEQPGDSDDRLRIGIAYSRGKDVPLSRDYAVYWLEPLAVAGNLDAQYWLGSTYCSDDAAKDCPLGVRWWRAAAEHDQMYAQVLLAVSYEVGTVVPQDMKLAVYWYTRAANNGYRLGALQLGRLYSFGKGVPRDLVQSHMWYNLSASAGNEDAGKARDALERSMTPVQIAEAERFARDWRPNSENSSQAKSPQNSESLATAEKPQSFGTGFVVSLTGHILTNHHVVDGCSSVRISPSSTTVRIVSSDANNDLAILKSDVKFTNVAAFREGRGIRAGDDVIAFGFPLTGVLSSSGNVSVGVVSALTGLKNDSSRIQISAPVQPGNSGGPLIDRNGRVVGVIVSKLNAMQVAQVSGDIPQNVNFAISAPAARAFLDAYDVHYETVTSSISLEASEIADRARKYTVLIECWK